MIENEGKGKVVMECSLCKCEMQYRLIINAECGGLTFTTLVKIKVLYQHCSMLHSKSILAVNFISSYQSSPSIALDELCPCWYVTVLACKLLSPHVFLKVLTCEDVLPSLSTIFTTESCSSGVPVLHRALSWQEPKVTAACSSASSCATLL